MKSKNITRGLLAFYLVALVWIILFKMQFSFSALPHMRSLNLIPFGASVVTNDRLDLSEIILNVIAFVPFGIFLQTLWAEKPFFQKAVPILLTTLALEALQYILAVGASDITDVITNSLGGMLGIALAVLLSKVCRKNWRKLINLFSLIFAVGLLGLIGMLLVVNL